MTTIGPTAFAVVVDRLHAGCEVWCLKCAQRFQLDAAALTMTVGREVIGYCGPCSATVLGYAPFEG